MNTLRKCMSLILCPCVSAYAFPVVANTTVDHSEYVKISLTDEEMMRAVGANGSVDVEMADYKFGGATASAVITNRFSLVCNYELNLTNTNGQIIQTLASGTIAPGTTMVVTGTPPRGGTENRYIQARIYHPGLPGLTAVDSSWASASLDSDGDGLSDSVELQYGLDPDDPADATQDMDGDGLTNADEIGYGTDLRLADTDSDGINDGNEVFYGLDPLDAGDAAADPDKDFLTNAEEINQYQTNPYVVDLGVAPDTDGDGLNDRLEVALGLDPASGQSKLSGGDTPEMQKILHVLNRTTFGPTNQLIDEVQQTGLNEWLTGQLTPIGLDNNPTDPAQAMRDANKIAFTDYLEYFGAIRPMHTLKQVQAKIGMFWDNHFNTSIVKTQSNSSELYEEDQFFVNAFGNFRQLLGISAKSNAMLTYLDLKTSKANALNENYAREVMELHTLGVSTPENPTYSQADVVSLAKILTGWSAGGSAISRYTVAYDGVNYYKPGLALFTFNSGNHDTTANKPFLGTTLSGVSGQAEGERALDMLANHASTAQYVCTKLARYLVSDTPQTATINGCAGTFAATPGAANQMELVIRNLLDSAEFNDPATYRTKFKDNQEYMFGLARFLNWNAVGVLNGDGSISGDNIGGRITLTGQRQFAKAEPTGWSEDGIDWISADVALDRFREANRMVFDGNRTRLVQYFSGLGLTSEAGIIGHLMKVMLGGIYEPRHVELAYWALHPNGSAFSITASDAETRLKNLVARMAQLPEYSLQ